METGKRMLAVQWLMNIVIKKQDILIEDIEEAAKMESENIKFAYERGLNYPHALGGQIDEAIESEQHYQSLYQ